MIVSDIRKHLMTRIRLRPDADSIFSDRLYARALPYSADFAGVSGDGCIIFKSASPYVSTKIFAFVLMALVLGLFAMSNLQSIFHD